MLEVAPTMDIVEGIVRKDVVDVEDIVPRKFVVPKVREGREVIDKEVVVGDDGPSEPYAPLPGRNNRSCICAVVTSVLSVLGIWCIPWIDFPPPCASPLSVSCKGPSPEGSLPVGEEGGSPPAVMCIILKVMVTICLFKLS